MPSTIPPNLPNHAFDTNSSHNSPATTRVGTISTHSWGRYRFHQPAAIYDTTSGLYSHAPFRHEDYVATDHIYLPPSLTSTSPAQQQSSSAIQYPSPMSWHPARAYPHHTQWQSTNFLADTHASTSAPPVAQKVWLLECKHCQTFLTNRGMKVRSHDWFVLCPLTSRLPFYPGCFTASPTCSIVLYRRTSRQLFSLFCATTIGGLFPATAERAATSYLRVSHTDALLPRMWNCGRLHDCRSCEVSYFI